MRGGAESGGKERLSLHPDIQILRNVFTYSGSWGNHCTRTLAGDFRGNAAISGPISARVVGLSVVDTARIPADQRVS